MTQTTSEDELTQRGPYPEILGRLVGALTYRPGWVFHLDYVDRGQGSEGLTFDIITYGWNSHHRPQQNLRQFTHGLLCADCGEEFPCSGYRIDKKNPDSPRQPYLVHHYMPVPPAAYNETSWRRWLFEQIVLVERHEACEFFHIGKDQPYAPNHGPGWDPYIVTEITTDEDRRTSFRGEVKDK